MSAYPYQDDDTDPDPYHAVQTEIQSSLQTASTLRSSYVRIRNMQGTGRGGGGGESEELVWARNELKATLAALEADLEDLEESVKIVESKSARAFGLDDAEVTERRRYVGYVRREIENMRAELSNNANTNTNTNTLSSYPTSPRPTHPLSPTPLSPQPQYGGLHSNPNSRPQSRVSSPLPGGVWDRGGGDLESGRGGEDHTSQWAREEQQILLQQQDTTIDSIAGTLNTLQQQAGLMGREIGEHVELLEDLDRDVDHTTSKLDSAMSRMRKFIRDSEEKGSGWCVVILIIVLLVLLLAVILV